MFKLYFNKEHFYEHGLSHFLFFFKSVNSFLTDNFSFAQSKKKKKIIFAWKLNIVWFSSAYVNGSLL